MSGKLQPVSPLRQRGTDKPLVAVIMLRRKHTTSDHRELRQRLQGNHFHLQQPPSTSAHIRSPKTSYCSPSETAPSPSRSVTSAPASTCPLISNRKDVLHAMHWNTVPVGLVSPFRNCAFTNWCCSTSARSTGALAHGVPPCAACVQGFPHPSNHAR